MALTLATIRTRVRSLLNEASAGFFTDAEIDGWVADATLDVSAVAQSVERLTTISLAFNDRDYTLPTDSVAVKHVTRQDTGVGLGKITPTMGGHTSSATSGPTPIRWFEFNKTLYIEPIPDATSAGLVLDVFYALSTSDVTLLPDADQILATKYAVYQGKLKDEKYAQASLLFADYMNGLAFRRQDIYERTPHRESDLKIFLAGVERG